jgi:ATPase subunit of ABC transporter with duplicated ATPase domains
MMWLVELGAAAAVMKSVSDTLEEFVTNVSEQERQRQEELRKREQQQRAYQQAQEQLAEARAKSQAARQEAELARRSEANRLHNLRVSEFDKTYKPPFRCIEPEDRQEWAWCVTHRKRAQDEFLARYNLKVKSPLNSAGSPTDR